MPGFGDFARTAEEIEHEIFKRGLALGLDWNNKGHMRALARRALSCDRACMLGLLRSPVRQDKLTGEFFALSELMLENMRGSADVGVLTHGGVTWKAFGRALYEEHEAGASRKTKPEEG